MCAALTVFLVIDIVTLPETRITVRWVRAHTLAEVAASIDRARAVNPVIAVAARRAGGDDTILELPENHRDLLAREPDRFHDRVTATLDRNLMLPFIGGRVEVASYDPVVSAEEAASVEEDSRSVELPMEVWALDVRGGTERVRLYTDPERLRVYLVPVGVTTQVQP